MVQSHLTALQHSEKWVSHTQHGVFLNLKMGGKSSHTEVDNNLPGAEEIA